MPLSRRATSETARVGFSSIEAAARRLAGVAVETPLLNYPALDARLAARVLVKPETVQRTGSFKFRGAFNKLSQLPRSARSAGVVAFSSGNHAQGVAHAAQLLDVPALIIMPEDAPRTKIASTRSYGAEIKFYERHGEKREEIAAAIADERGATLVRPYDDPDIVAGQGTCGLEIARQAAARGWQLDAVLICCGGGGLSAGSALAVKHLSADTEVYVVEPAGFDDHARSLALGERIANEPGPKSFCDALLSPMPGELTFPINKRLLSGGLSVSDDEVAAAMAYAFHRMKLVVEPGGAVSLAALLAGKLPVEGRTVAITLSGGNVDPDVFAQAIAAGTRWAQ